MFNPNKVLKDDMSKILSNSPKNDAITIHVLDYLNFTGVLITKGQKHRMPIFGLLEFIDFGSASPSMHDFFKIENIILQSEWYYPSSLNHSSWFGFSSNMYLIF